MSTSRAFDLALFVNTPANANDASVIVNPAAPFTTAFKPVALSSKPGGVTVGADVPAANASNQILISGAGPGFAWALGNNPAAAATVPTPTAQYQLMMADATPTWQTTTIPVILGLGGAVTNSGGGSFVVGASLAFASAAALTTRINGGDPLMSAIDNFTIDCGVF